MYITLKPDQATAIRNFLSHPDDNISKRAAVLLAYANGIPTIEVSRDTGMSTGRCRYWKRRFNSDGLAIFPEAESDDQEMADSPKPVKEKPVNKAANKTKEVSKKEKPAVIPDPVSTDTVPQETNEAQESTSVSKDKEPKKAPKSKKKSKGEKKKKAGKKIKKAKSDKKKGKKKDQKKSAKKKSAKKKKGSKKS